jgi:energy-coupling factor transport system permease protein
VGINYGIITALRLLLIVVIAGVLFDVPYYEYLLAFKKWHIPYEISFLVATVIHLLPIFNTHFEQRREALLLRGIDLRKLPLVKRPAAYLTLLFPIVANTINEVKTRAISLELRAFRIYPQRSSLYSSTLYPKDYITFSIYITILIFMIYLIR